MRQIMKVLFVVFVLSVPAMAHVTSTLNPGETYLPVIQFTSPTFGQCLGASISGSGAWCFALNPSNLNVPTGIPTSLFATRDSVNTLISPLATKAEVSSLTAKAFRLAAISAALKDAVPNSGDRFAIRLNAGGFNGNIAGAVGFSANVYRGTRVLLNYGRGKSENSLSGGLNFSFH